VRLIIFNKSDNIQSTSVLKTYDVRVQVSS